MKRVLKWLGIIVLLLAAAAGFVIYTAFGPTSAIVDGQELAPGVRTIKDGFVAVYMIDAGDGKVALVDAGKDKSAHTILDELTRRKLDPSAVAAIFLTHGHGDHIAGCKKFPAAKVYAIQADIARMEDAVQTVTPVTDGQVIAVGNTQVEVFATPGHTPGSATYLARGVLFFGDSAGASKEGQVLPAVRLFSSNPAENVSSLKALATKLSPRATEVTKLAFGHSGSLDGLAPLVAFH